MSSLGFQSIYRELHALPAPAQAHLLDVAKRYAALSPLIRLLDELRCE